MEERAWVNTLSNEEFVKWGIKFFRTDWDDASVVMSFKEIRESAIKLLSKPHETTADEDFAEIGYRKQPEKYSDEVRYTNDEFEVVVLKKETRLRIFPSIEVVNVSLEENKIRKIANKKRKEVWG